MKAALKVIAILGLLGLAACAGESATTTSTTDVAEAPLSAPTSQSGSSSAEDCDFDGQSFTDGPVVHLETLAEVDGVTVKGAVYPHPDYEGDPWSQWGQGLVTSDGRFFSAIGDHMGRDGNSYIYEYDPSTDRLHMIADVLSYVDHEQGSWGYGKIHGQMSPGPCGEIYLSTYWGSYRGLEFGGSYSGDILMRLDPHGRTLETLGVPVDEHGQASLAGAPSVGLIYGEAVDPVKKDVEDVTKGPFFVYDVESEKVIFENPESHVGYRNIMVDRSGRAYFALGDSRLAVYDPATNQVGVHPSELPGDWLRASTYVTAEGTIYGVTREPDQFFAMDVEGGITDLGPARDYAASIAVAPDGRHFYYLPDAHGDAWEAGAPLIRVDGASGHQETLVELGPVVEESLGYRLGGTYNIAVSPLDGTVFVGANIGPIEEDEPGFGEVVLLVVGIP